MKKKIVILVVCAILVAGAVVSYKNNFWGLVGSSSSADGSGDMEIYASKLDSMLGASASYNPDTFMGVVEGQQSTAINKSSERELDQTFVSVGDTVSVGTPLFSYKKDSYDQEIKQYGFDIEGYNLQLEDYNRQIEKLNTDLAKIKGQTDDDKTKREDINNQIATLNYNIKMTQNSINQTNAKIEECNKKSAASTVTSTVAGVVTKIADDTNPYTSDGSYITILASGEMRVKGTINEQNVWSINVDTPVTLRSRVDKSQTWTGTITSIDTESKVTDNSDYYSSSSSDDTTSTKYPFYVTLDSSDGLMMGQHLYIEIGSSGETSSFDLSDGVYIYDYYLAYDEDGNPYVWTANAKNKLTKTPVTLGDYDETNMVYKVESGLSREDYVVYPMEDYTEGMTCVKDQEAN